jgi:hypothetical protein
MGRACCTNRGDKECIYDIGGKAKRKQILREKGWSGMDWVNLAEDRD